RGIGVRNLTRQHSPGDIGIGVDLRNRQHRTYARMNPEPTRVKLPGVLEDENQTAEQARSGIVGMSLELRGQSQRGSVRLPISQRVPGCQPGDDGRCGRTEPPGVWDRVRAPQPQPRYGDSQVSTSGPQRTVYEVGLVTGHI